MTQHIIHHLHLLPLAWWLIAAVLSCFFVANYLWWVGPVRQTDYCPNVLLIIPVRGVPKTLRALWHSLCQQTYRPYRVVFAVESASDPAYAALQSLDDGPPVEIIVAGPAVERGQKVHNLLAALDTVRPTDSVIVFADADVAPMADWLVRLVTPLSDPDTTVVSGYRWMVPADGGWPSAFVCLANASVVTLPRWGIWNLAWGGSIAIRRRSLDELKVRQHWSQSVLDDLPLTRAVRLQGRQVYCPYGALVPSPASFSWKEAIAFGRRQYLFVRWYVPHHWALAAVGTTVPLLGWAFAIPLAVTGDRIAIGTILAANAFDQVRATLRRRIPRKLWAIDHRDRMTWLDRWATPIWLAFHAAVIWSTLRGRSLTWGGRTYWVDSKRHVRRIVGH